MTVGACFFAVGFTLGLAALDQPQDAAPSRDDTGSVDRAAARVERLIEAHGCWTGEAPPKYQGEIPGGVVVTKGDRSFYSTQLVGPALDQVFADKDAGLVVHAFCP